jgi:D-beta-D-heptose 7-phosphate kinase/D-beta-D-heptose 1-phosphate adenosyltransferase
MTAATSNRADLAALVGRFRDTRVWVAGDIMLDDYLQGDVDRISPEAPIQVVRVRTSRPFLGGAGNVARQLATLGARVRLCGMIGDDEPGETILGMCSEIGIDSSAIGRRSSIPTTRKMRILGQRNQQLLRLDWEETTAHPPEITVPLVERLTQGSNPDVVLISDYAKGFLEAETVQAICKAAKDRGAIIIVDPKRTDFSFYRGANIIKPNLKEIEAATGMSLRDQDYEAVADVARQFVEDLDLDAMVVTMGGRGMLTVTRDGGMSVVKSDRRTVFDVSGAGDTALAVLALGLAVGAELNDALALANTAAGVAVGEVGTTAVTNEDIVSALDLRPAAKIMSRQDLATQLEAWRLEGQTIVFTNGCFDLLHIGHLDLLRQAAELGDKLVLAINSDSSVRGLKGDTRPLIPETERATLLAALECVDAITIFAEETPLEILTELRPDVLVKGQDYQLHEVVGRELVESLGGRVELVPLLPEHSTSALIDRIRRS